MKYIIPKHLADKMDKAYGAIYMWINLHNNHKYIGQAMMHRLNAREHEHATTIDGCTLLNKAIKKYGHFNFLRIVIDVAYSADELDEKEIYWIAKYNTFKGEGYNCTTGGNGWTMSGVNHPKFGGYVLVMTAEKYEFVGVYQGVCEVVRVLSTEDKQLNTSGVSKAMRDLEYCHQHQGYVYKKVGSEVYVSYITKDMKLVNKVVAEYKLKKELEKKAKERKAYVKKMGNKKFILLASCVPSKDDKIFKSQTEVANFLNISQAKACRYLKSGKPCQDYILSYINFEQYEALAI